MKEPSDLELMLAVKAGDRTAFEQLYRRYRDRLYAFLVRYTGDPSSAQDLFQETFLRVFRDRARYEPRAAFATWLFTIARNLFLDSVKRAWTPGTFIEPETATLSIPDPTPGPLETLAQEEAEAVLRRAVASLAEEDRAILLLSRFEGLRYREIAKILGTSEGAVKVRAHRALQALRRALTD
ncbi:MAG: sigma-70 family RNA polymerase sigma factor [candidate division NC10 bacterium]|nr:sigma-70 family RNA polymerase sigma factor [candidate division NC10 bacterium]